MKIEGVYLDANLLVLLVVGSVDKRLIDKHKRTGAFTPGKFDWLVEFLHSIQHIFVTPNVLTEASNLLEDARDRRPMSVLRDIIGATEEVVVPSSLAAGRPHFTKLGLTDSALLERVSKTIPLLTTDFDLYGAAMKQGHDVAINLSQYYEWVSA